ncbi:MAG: hypothetical protein AAGU05_13890, partial [Anaerolineaceae bacterium]
VMMEDLNPHPLIPAPEGGERKSGMFARQTAQTFPQRRLRRFDGCVLRQAVRNPARFFLISEGSFKLSGLQLPLLDPCICVMGEMMGAVLAADREHCDKEAGLLKMPRLIVRTI